MRALVPSLLAFALQAQAPAFLDQLPPAAQAEALDIMKRADFMFETQNSAQACPSRHHGETFRSSRSWGRHVAVLSVCARLLRLHPSGWRLEHRRYPRSEGTLRLIYRRPGHRVYLVEGRAENGRLKTSFPVGAKMLTSYRYWEGKNGFESHLQTWTALDSALLGVMARPFRGYIKGRQDEFIAYINGNVATFGEFAELSPRDFHGPLKRDGDPMALREFEALFPGK